MLAVPGKGPASDRWKTFDEPTCAPRDSAEIWPRYGRDMDENTAGLVSRRGRLTTAGTLWQ